MYDTATRRHALALHRSGLTLSETSRATGISRSALRAWTRRIEPAPGTTAECPLRTGTLAPGLPAADYGYLLGLYLGDGCLSEGRRGVHALRIACGNAWPGLVEECARAVRAVMPTSAVLRVAAPGCTSVVSTSKHWPCLFPQHGPGPKHLRPVRLADWQRPVVSAHPWPFVRGLIHSDGCRTVNTATRRTGGTVQRHEYPRYFFTNGSRDIVRLFTDSLDSLGVEWQVRERRTGHLDVSVARRASVALLDAHVGPKW
ncbi:helix-turn-helix domain-containing protein [Streptomyces sp. NRRL B-24484]|uniref:helix-turn-helix domain-containing protein n=1 Tax=Streptomyces sp. NRRL B-24484 TaxID=1463833 RepID=UPI0004BF57E0|nr:helix-turn-helix domain-containing protein [Streptomyces sp. NRRL B-24484]